MYSNDKFYVLKRGLFWCLFPELRSKKGYEHQINGQVHA